ncbi:hypothetical protein QQF64_017325 [Cirrhinus molitorella]|uniref:Uncharacterized protein n=1 Tax=Cirrhinus molitorella TaxID=172907 RepID=A0ABR3LIB9_9TELE
MCSHQTCGKKKTLDDIEEKVDKEVFLQCLKDLMSLIDSLTQSTKTPFNITPDEPNELDMLKELYSRQQTEKAQAHQILGTMAEGGDQSCHNDTACAA